MYARSLSLLRSVSERKTGIAASGFATEMIEVNAATKRVVDPDKYVE